METYAIKWASGTTEAGFATYEAACAAVREALKSADIGHSGDINDGGEATLFWSSDGGADDGSRAAGKIQRRITE